MNDDNTNIEPVDLSPNRAELVERVKSRGRQIRARRRLAISGLAALVVAGIAVPAIAIGSNSSSSPQPPTVTAAPTVGDFRIALVLRVQDSAAHFGDPCVSSPLDDTRCYVLGRTLVSASDVQSTAVVHDAAGWVVDTVFGHSAYDRLATHEGEQIAVVVGDQVLDAPTLGAPKDFPRLVAPPGLTRDQAIALATQIAGRPPTQVDPSPGAISSRIELPGTTFVAGTEVQGTLVIENNTGSPVTLERAGECHGKWEFVLTNAAVPKEFAFTSECGTQRTVLAPGTNRLPFTLSTSYGSCLGKGGSGPASMVHCLANGRIPPLPAGIYHTALGEDFGPGRFPVPRQVTVRLVAAPTSTS